MIPCTFSALMYIAFPILNDFATKTLEITRAGLPGRLIGYQLVFANSLACSERQRRRVNIVNHLLSDCHSIVREELARNVPIQFGAQPQNDNAQLRNTSSATVLTLMHAKYATLVLTQPEAVKWQKKWEHFPQHSLSHNNPNP